MFTRSGLGRLVSVIVVIAVILVRADIIDLSPDVAPDVAPQGFSGDSRQPPSIGTWRAIGTYTENKGYFGRTVGERIERRWTTAKNCSSGTCSYSVTRQMRDREPTTAALELQRDGWHATFPELTLSCQPGQTWQQHTTFVFRFTDGGRRLQANEVHHSFAEACGYGKSRVEWTAERVADGRKVLAGPVGRNAGPVNGIREKEMAASIRLAVQRDLPQIASRISAVRGRRIELEPVAGHTSCRSREHTRSRRGAAFQCSVILYSPDAASPMFKARILVAEIEGRCWRAINDLFVEPGRGSHRFSAADVQRQLAIEPLRGCA